MKKIIALFAAVFLCLIARGPAQQQPIYFDPSVSNTFTNASFTGSLLPPYDDPATRGRLIFVFTDLNPSPLTSAFSITGLSATGLIADFNYEPVSIDLIFNDLSINTDGTFSSEFVALPQPGYAVSLEYLQAIFTLPGGTINRGAYFNVQLSISDSDDQHVVTSETPPSAWYVAGGARWIGTASGSASGNWDAPDNWAGVDVPEGGALIDFLFGGTNNTTSTNNLEGLEMRGIEFLDGAGAFTIEGNSVDFFGGKIENNSAIAQTINFDFTFSDANQQVNPNTDDITLGGGGTINNNGFNMEVNGANTLTLDKTMTGAGGLTLEEGSRVNVTGSQTFTGDITVKNNAVLLISQTDSISNDVNVTLSGGTIQRGNDVSEVFGNLNLTTASFLDFGTGPSGTLAFGTYTPNFKLDVLNFSQGNALRFVDDISDFLPTGGALSNAYFSFNNGFTYNSSTFTITAIPEPSTYVAAAGLLGLFLWSARRRLFKTAGAQVVASGTGEA
jgi:hypothetical protein